MQFNRTEPGDGRVHYRPDGPVGEPIIDGFREDREAVEEGDGSRRRRRRDFPDPLSATVGKAVSRIAKYTADVELVEKPNGVLEPATGRYFTVEVTYNDPETGWHTQKHTSVKRIIIVGGFMTFVT
jgi:hypothetical protein